ncbi:MAG: hypothetical protein ACPG1C_10280 [Alphaproteobacteria bacterium]
MTHLSFNDGSNAAPRLRLDMNMGTLMNLPDWSGGPQTLFTDQKDAIEKTCAAGFVGMQSMFAEPAVSMGVPICGMGRIDKPEDAEIMAVGHKQQGFQASTVHVGLGIESDDEVDVLVSAILAACEKHDYPIFIETHRATITQDIRRTVDLAARFPDVRFNGDFSHWYTGLEMTYGGFDKRLDFLQPVFDRIRYMHGRIGTTGAIQVAVNGADDDRDFVQHHRAFLVRAMQGFLSNATPGDILIYAPELLPPDINYGRAFPDADGNLREEADRFEQAQILGQIAQACWLEAGGSE